MSISKRIKSIVDEIEFDVLADIGTDHGYMPIYAIKTSKINKAIACDVNVKPLSKAVENIKKYNLSNNIETRLGFGLKPLTINEVSTIVISGMGGKLIIDILEDGKNILDNVNQIILQPQSDFKEVRKYIHNLNYKIKKEVVIKEDTKYYNIINCVRGKDTFYDELDYSLGKISLQKDILIFLEFLSYKLNKLNFIIKKIPNHKELEIKKINNNIKIYEEILKKYEYKM